VVEPLRFVDLLGPSQTTTPGLPSQC